MSKQSVVVVTGAGAGIGYAISQRLAAAGYKVLGLDISARDAEAGITFLQADVTDEDQVAAAVAAAQQLGAVKGLVNNAGIERHGSVVTMPADEWARVIDVNLNAHARVSRHVIPLISAAGGGSIVNMSSAQGLATQQNVAAYAAAKGGVIALTRAMALDHADQGIRVNAVSPGTVETELVRANAASFNPDDPAGQLARWGSMHALRRLARPSEVAELVEFLISPRSSFMTGANYLVDGGLLASFGGPDL